VEGRREKVGGARTADLKGEQRSAGLTLIGPAPQFPASFGQGVPTSRVRGGGSVEELLYEGKAKIVYRGSHPGTLRVYFKDDATAFNAQKRGSIVGKGVINNQISATLFRYLEAQGVPTHFLNERSEREMEVWEVKILPLEVVLRNRAAGTFCRRYGAPRGLRFPFPLVEFSLKNDALGDPLIYEEAVVALGLAEPSLLAEVRQRTLQINELLKAYFEVRHLELVDFKLEFGLREGTLLLADEISPDTMRLWELGSEEPMDKDRFRQDLGRVEEAYQEVWRRVRGGEG